MKQIETSSNRVLLERTKSLIREDEWMMDRLRDAEMLGLPDCFIAGGFIRNMIWDHLHGYKQRTPLNDIDVVYCDLDEISENRDKELTQRIEKMTPCGKWSVKNQARMHERNGHLPYANTTDAIAHWVEIPTCIGARLCWGDEIEISAPLGIEHNFSLIVGPNPLSGCQASVYNDRIKNKEWAKLWPMLRIIWA